MKILIIANSCPWQSWPTKIAAIKAFYAPLVDLHIDIQHTSFANIPFKDYPGLVTSFVDGKTVDALGADTEVDQEWFKQNIVPLIGGYDIAIFQLGDVAPRAGLPLGIKFGEFGSTWCCETFVTTESSNYYLPGMINYGDLATIIIEHEIAHALYSMTLQHDRTHEFFYSNQFPKVLTDIVLPNVKNDRIIALYKQLLALLQQELGLLKQQSRSDPTPPPHDTITPMPPPTQPAFPPMIIKWAHAITKGEGATPQSHNQGNLKYGSLTKSWGAKQGRAALDGGYFCQFVDDAAGFNALCNFLVLGAENQLIAFHAPEARTLGGFTKIYAGNPPQGYINGIVAALGVPPTTQIATFL